MGKLLSDKLNNVRPMFSVDDVDHLFKWYGIRKENGSVEGLGNIASNIAIGFGDFVIRAGHNLKAIVTESKRSSLKALVDGHKLGMMRVMSGSYSLLATLQVGAYPFSVAPHAVNDLCKTTFDQIHMKKRLASIIENYLHLASAIHLGDMGLASKLLGTINDLNMAQQLNIKSSLSDMVSASSEGNFTEFGKVFDSVSEYKDAVHMALSYSSEIEEAHKNAQHLDILYKAYDKLKDAITHTSTKKTDMSQLTGIASTIHATGELIESYAMLVKEYHHLEHFLCSVGEAALKVMKQDN